MARVEQARTPRRLLVACVLLVGTALLHPSRTRADEGFDWEFEEQPAGPFVTALRNGRDGTIGILEDLLDLQLGVFSEVSLLAGAGVMALSDVVGVIDDNPASQHVFKGIASQSLAKTAYLLHVAGSEALLGGHDLETEWAVTDAMGDLNPLLSPEDVAPPLPLDPFAFVGEAWVHTDVYTSRIPGRIGLSAVVADGLVRPAGNVLRIFGLTERADGIEKAGTRLVREAASE